MNVFETIAERRIKAAREAGLFDNLPGAGKPIPDLGRERPPGWWAARVVKRERSKLRAEELDRAVQSEVAAMWRLDAEQDVREGVAAVNREIEEYNKLTTWEPLPLVDPGDVVTRWRNLRDRRGC